LPISTFVWASLSMSILEWCQGIQDSGLSRIISESTWGYPIVGALHVLALALFGGAVLIPHVRVLGFGVRNTLDSDFVIDVRWIRRVGLTLVVVTGVILFASSAVQYYESTSFRIKMALLTLIALNAIAAARRGLRKWQSALSLALWAAVIFASRGIAFF